MGWLVLSRQQDQEIVCLVDGKLVRIMVAEIRRDCVKLALEAPAEVRILRRELFDEERGAA